MGFFSRVLNLVRRTEQPAKPLETRHEGGIRYDADLVPSLKQDYQNLLGIYGEVSRAAADSRFDLVKSRLHDLKHNLQTHLVVENVRFYVYLQQHLASDQNASALIADLRKEMDGIARAAVQFVNRYETAEFTPELAETFRKELAGIGEVLVKRISTEESRLYTLYMPSY